MMRTVSYILILLLLSSCVCASDSPAGESSCRYARFFDVVEMDSCISVILLSPDGSRRDTVHVSGPVDNIICMSSSHVAALALIGADSLISGVSGAGYISNPVLRERYAITEGVQRRCIKRAAPLRPLRDVGYEAALDYEKILELRPDMLVTYTVSGAEPPYVTKLRSMGIPVMVLHDHLENHPLARAEYVRLFGALTHRLPVADSVFNAVCENYERIAGEVAATASEQRKVLINTPYAEAWYIPGEESYMSRLIRDAGGRVLGSVKGTSASGVISLETAYGLSQQADLWLNPGTFRSREQLRGAHQLFSEFGPVSKGLPIYNNTLRITPEGGNDFWESGAMRPDLILQDLIAIFHDDSSHVMNYFISLN